MSSVSDWFALTVSPWELIARGTILYLGLILTLRFVLRRDIGSLSVADLMFIVIVADASQNALSGEYKSITEGAILIGTLVAWNVALDWLAYRSPRFRRVLEPPALPLIKDGRAGPKQPSQGVDHRRRAPREAPGERHRRRSPGPRGVPRVERRARRDPGGSVAGAEEEAAHRRGRLAPRATLGSLHRHALREIARLVHVGAAQHRDVIGEELQRNHVHDG